jgi:hypothetical protein
VGLSWQQGPLSPGAIGRFLVPERLPKRLLYAEPLRRRMRVRFSGIWIAESERVLLLFEPGHYPIAYFPEASTRPSARTKGCAVTTTSVTHVWRHGRIVRPMLRSAASPIWCRSSRTSSRYSSTASSFILSRVSR